MRGRDLFDRFHSLVHLFTPEADLWIIIIIPSLFDPFARSQRWSSIANVKEEKISKKKLHTESWCTIGEERKLNTTHQPKGWACKKNMEKHKITSYCLDTNEHTHQMHTRRREDRQKWWCGGWFFFFFFLLQDRHYYHDDDYFNDSAVATIDAKTREEEEEYYLKTVSNFVQHKQQTTATRMDNKGVEESWTKIHKKNMLVPGSNNNKTQMAGGWK